MKSISKLALVLLCFVSACGGKTDDDHAIGDTGAISSVGGSSQDETGGTSNAPTSTTAWTATGGSSYINSTSTLNVTGGSTSNQATGGSSAVQTTASTGGSSTIASTTSASIGGATGILHLLEPPARELPDKTVIPGQTDITVFEFTLSAEQRNIRVPRMYIDVHGSIKNDELMPVTIVDEANNIVVTENPTPFGEVYTFGEYDGAFWFTPFTVDASAPPKTFRVKTGIEPTAHVGKTFRFGIDTSTNLYPMVDDYYEVQTCNLGIYGSQFTVAESLNTNNGTGGSTSISATGGASSTGGSSTTDTPLAKLTLKIANDTPASSIVLPGTETLFTKYLLTNPGDRDTYIISTILGIGSSAFGDLSAIRMTDCGTENWEHSFNTCGDPATCYFREGSYSSSQNFSSSEKRLHAPPRSTVPVCLYATPATVVSRSSTEDTGSDSSPHSGDMMSVRIGSMITNDADAVSFESPYDPPKMVLRKAKPVVTILPLNQTTISNDATMELFKFHISSSSNNEPIDFRDFSLLFNISDLDPTNIIDIVNLRLSKDTTEMGFDEVNIGDSKWINAISYAGGTISFSFSPNNSIIGNPGITYTVTGKILRAQIGDVVSISFIRSRATQPFTGYLCKPQFELSNNIIDTTDYDTCLTKSAGWMNQGRFHWSDMSDPVNNKDWTDDYLVNDLSGSSVLTY